MKVLSSTFIYLCLLFEEFQSHFGTKSVEAVKKMVA